MWLVLALVRLVLALVRLVLALWPLVLALWPDSTSPGPDSTSPGPDSTRLIYNLVLDYREGNPGCGLGHARAWPNSQYCENQRPGLD